MYFNKSKMRQLKATRQKKQAEFLKKERCVTFYAEKQ